MQRQHATKSCEVSLFGISPLREYDDQVKTLMACATVGTVRVRVTGFDETEESGIAAEERSTFYGCKRRSCLARDERQGLDSGRWIFNPTLIYVFI